MTARGDLTKAKILDAAEAMILDQGFSATSLDRVLEKTGLTKGAFFYHFKNKNELLQALVERHSLNEEETFDGNFARAANMSRDPLQQVLIAIGFFIEQMEEMLKSSPEDLNPGCLFASYAYELETVVPEIHDRAKRFALYWRKGLRAKLDEIAERYPPRIDMDLDAVADNLLVAFEGGLVMGRILDDPRQIVEHLKNYRTYIELLFSPQ